MLTACRPSRKQDGPVSGLWVLPWQRPTTVPGARDHQAPLVMAAVGPSSGQVSTGQSRRAQILQPHNAKGRATASRNKLASWCENLLLRQGHFPLAQDNASAALLLFTAGSGGFACEVPCSSPAERVTGKFGVYSVSHVSCATPQCTQCTFLCDQGPTSRGLPNVTDCLAPPTASCSNLLPPSCPPQPWPPTRQPAWSTWATRMALSRRAATAWGLGKGPRALTHLRQQRQRTATTAQALLPSPAAVGPSQCCTWRAPSGCGPETLAVGCSGTKSLVLVLVLVLAAAVTNAGYSTRIFMGWPLCFAVRVQGASPR